MLTIPQAALVASELLLIVIVGLIMGRVLGRILVRRLGGYTRTSCRMSDTDRVERTHEVASEAYQKAQEVRAAAEALERHLKGAAHV